MLCVECSHSISVPALIIAMEQSDHFALQRNSEACADCARKLFEPVERLAGRSRFWHQSMGCAACGNNPIIIRLRFSTHRCQAHIALCQHCYAKIRDQLLRNVPNTVGFLDKEWQTAGTKSGQRFPWAIGTRVVVKKHVPRYHGEIGKITSFRGLLQSWYGYEVIFDGSGHHFFHERDLDVLEAEERRPQMPYEITETTTTPSMVNEVATVHPEEMMEPSHPAEVFSEPAPLTAAAEPAQSTPDLTKDVQINVLDLEPIEPNLPLPAFPLG